MEAKPMETKNTKPMKNKIEYIKDKIDRFGTISIFTGKLTDIEIKEFQKYFQVRPEPFGYTNFKRIR